VTTTGKPLKRIQTPDQNKGRLTFLLKHVLRMKDMTARSYAATFR
jgi:hypothetical protein